MSSPNFSISYRAFLLSAQNSSPLSGTTLHPGFPSSIPPTLIFFPCHPHLPQTIPLSLFKDAFPDSWASCGPPCVLVAHETSLCFLVTLWFFFKYLTQLSRQRSCHYLICHWFQNLRPCLASGTLHNPHLAEYVLRRIEYNAQDQLNELWIHNSPLDSVQHTSSLQPILAKQTKPLYNKYDHKVSHISEQQLHPVSRTKTAFVTLVTGNPL